MFVQKWAFSFKISFFMNRICFSIKSIITSIKMIRRRMKNELKQFCLHSKIFDLLSITINESFFLQRNMKRNVSWLWFERWIEYINGYSSVPCCYLLNGSVHLKPNQRDEMICSSNFAGDLLLMLQWKEYWNEYHRLVHSTLCMKNMHANQIY